MDSIKPFSPAEAKQSKLHGIPGFIIETVNELLSEKYSDTRITIKQEEIMNRAAEKYEGIFDYSWLDFEPLYRKEGWKVFYDKPAYNENYKPFYVFTKQE